MKENDHNVLRVAETNDQTICTGFVCEIYKIDQTIHDYIMANKRQIYDNITTNIRPIKNR